MLNGVFCIDCVTFATTTSTISNLVKTPLTNWNNALEWFKSHTKSPTHLTASLKAAQFRACIADNSKSIDVQLDSIVSKQFKLNREKLIPIVEAIILCGRQNIALRGHRDDATYIDDESVNCGNLQAILGYLVKFGNNVLFQEHIATVPQHATYRSKTTQNEIINICGKMITEKIVDEIKRAKFFSILADEAADVSNLKELALVLHFVDQSAKIREAFLGFFHCDERLAGKDIANKLTSGIKDLGLQLSFCRGQGYDGAGNMAGKCIGASTLILKESMVYPYSLKFLSLLSILSKQLKTILIRIGVVTPSKMLTGCFTQLSRLN